MKSGGNDFHSSTSLNKTPRKTQADNIDDNLRAQGIGAGNAIANRYSMSSDLGGRIIKDKLWFYVGIAQADRRPVAARDLHARRQDARNRPRAVVVQHQQSLVPDVAVEQLVGFYALNHKYDTSNLSQFIPWNSRGGLMTPSQTGKVEWQKVVRHQARDVVPVRILELRQPLLQLRASPTRHRFDQITSR